MGPLQGIRIVEIVGIGPGPFTGMMLADMGAEIIVIDRYESTPMELKVDINRRGKKSLIVDLKSGQGREVFFKLVASADGLFEGFRPGVMEKLGLGPEDCFKHNPGLVYGRMTGWGQDGPLARTAGHDINYIALAGALHGIGSADRAPAVPLNLVGDYGGGGMMLAFGMVCGLLEARKSGKGQVIDASMVEGASVLMSFFHSLMANEMWAPEREANLLDGGAHFYGCYETSDGKYISIGAIEPAFIQTLVEKAGLDPGILQHHMTPHEWAGLKTEFMALFKTRSQQEWCELLEGTDACFAPVLPFWEAHEHPHNRARNSFIEIDGLVQPAPTPRFGRTQAEVTRGPVSPGADSQSILVSLGYSGAEINQLSETGVIADEKKS